MHQLIEISNTLKILDVFMNDPYKEFMLREIGRIVNLDHKSVMIHLNKLMKLQLVKHEKGNLYKVYKANVTDYYKKVKISFNLIKLKESGVIDYITEQIHPKAIILYGSYSKGTDRVDSDIDLFLDSSERKMDLIYFEKLLKRKFHLLFTGKMSKELKNNLINGVVISGYLNYERL